MTRLEDILSLIDHLLDSRKKRHIVGGILMSASLMFGGLAFTVVTLKNEEDDDNDGRCNW